MTLLDDVPLGGNPDRILGEALRLAQRVWANEDRNVEREPDYDPAPTVAAAVELAGAVVALDGLLRAGEPIPSRWAQSDN